MMRYTLHEQGNAPRDWPSERFEALWCDVAAASGSGAFTAEAAGRLPVVAMPDWSNPPLDSWVCVEGRLEQRVPMGEVHRGGEEWFVRGVSGVPVAAYVMDAPPTDVGERVRVVGRVIGPLRLADRRGEMREYPAVIGKAVVNADGRAAMLAQENRGMGGGTSWPLVSGGAVLVLLVAWFVLRRFLRPSGGVRAIHAAAAAARVGSGQSASPSCAPSGSSGGRA